ncbi:helix-turn-helix domain-containing protein, partial [Bacillus safensis]|uniref:helix-turn-helix domain-containing protein n=1 Tax=Bacillus safensis TaxID=561879 RepID=UPI003391083F
MPSLCERLKQLRNVYRPKLTQQALSEELNITRAAYTRYETGDSEPDIETLISLAKFPTEFLNGKAILITTFERMINGRSIFGVEGYGNRPIQRIG